MEVLIIGGGTGGLTLGLMLHRAASISRAELAALSDAYNRVAGYDRESLGG